MFHAPFPNEAEEQAAGDTVRLCGRPKSGYVTLTDEFAPDLQPDAAYGMSRS